ncbi:redoxin family protein [Larkinella sp. VNQ87]|uniref:redoxin family protein n=1 Tax=Larkinella sp. VNQ87 TaxID=3400921 RepID=UPI003C08123B
MIQLATASKLIRFSIHLLLLSGGFYSIGFSQVIAPQPFSLQGTLSTVRQGKVYLLSQDKTPIDSTELVDNRFSFRGQLAEPGLHLLQVANDEMTYPVFLEGTSMRFTLNKDQTYQVTGSSLHTQWDAYENKFLGSARDKLIRLFSEKSNAQQKGDSILVDKLRRQNDTLSVAIGREMLDWVTRKPYTFFNVYLLQQRSFSDEFIANRLSELRPQFSNYPSFQSLEQGLKVRKQMLEKVAPNQVAHAFSLPDSSGKSYSLASLMNKAVLVDFWASWCGPCIQQMPALKALQAAFGPKGLTIIGVSIDDNRQHWLRALRRLQPAGIQLLASKNEEIKQQYALFSIPRTYLLTQDGKIVALNLEGEALTKKVAELLEQQR